MTFSLWVKALKRSYPFSAVTLLFGCAAIPDTGQVPVMHEIHHYQTQVSLRTPAHLQGGWPGDYWWRAYGDTQLDSLIEEALKDSPSLATTKARLKKALAVTSEAQAELLPSVNASGSLEPTRQSYHNGVPLEAVPKGWNNSASLMLNLNYELDFFGKNQAAFKAARAESQSAEAELAQARLELSVSVASCWANLLGQSRVLKLNSETIGLNRQMLDMALQRQRQGMETEDKISEARSNLASAQLQKAKQSEQIMLTRHQLAALLGAGPDRGLTITVPDNTTAPVRMLPKDLQSDLLAHRPDVIAARYLAEAEAQRIHVARAGFYPTVSLNASIGQQSLGLDYFTHSDSRAGSWGPSLTLPVFQGGALRAQYREASARYEEAVATYNRTLSEALQDVADSLTKLTALQTQLGLSFAAEAHAEKAWQITNIRYQGGLATFTEALIARNTLIQARQQRVEYETETFNRDIDINRALGGGFASVKQQ